MSIIKEPSQFYYLFHNILNNFNFKNNQSKKDIILLGQGWFAKGFLEHINKSKYNIINITRNEFVNTPLLLSTLKYENIPKKDEFRKKIDEELNEIITKIDVENQIVITNKNNYNFNDKYLVVGLGPNNDYGFYWNDKINQIKTIINNDLIKKINNICVVGSGPTGTELSFYLKDLGFNVSIVDNEKLSNLYNYISSNGKNKILNSLKNNNIDLITESLFNESISKKFDHHIFAIGSRSNDLTSSWKINSKLQLNGNTNIFAGGDCILQNYPKNAQVAYQQGEYVARYLNGENYDDFKYIDKGIALYIGNDKYYVEVNTPVGKLKNEISNVFINFYYKFFK